MAILIRPDELKALNFLCCVLPGLHSFLDISRKQDKKEEAVLWGKK